MEKIDELKKYYKNKNFSIIGLNDSQGVNTTSTLFRKGLLEYIASALEDENLKPIVINAFSLTLNKTEHIDSFLRANLSLEEIKLSQIYSVVSALEKVMKDLKLPQFLGKIGYATKKVYKIDANDKNIFISDTIRNSEEPTIVYSSGVNNLMREVASNPFAIKKQYKNRHVNMSYNYTLEKSQNPETLKIVMDGIENNFNTIFNINNKSDVYVLGAYIPKSLTCEGMNIFRELVLRYNEQLMELCKSYNAEFVDTEDIGKRYNKSNNNFHINSEGHNALANYILSKMYEKKIVKNEKSIVNPKKKVIITNKGPKELRNEYLEYYNDLCKKQVETDNLYIANRLKQLAAERYRESDIMDRVSKKTSK